MIQTRITARCELDIEVLQDIGADLVEKFGHLRSQDPEGGDRIECVKQRPCYSLHSSRYRAATWLDAEHNVVWLLAAGIHKTGDRDDFYDVVEQLEQTGSLYPTPDDYSDLEIEQQLDRLKRETAELRQMRDRAIAMPNEVQRLTSEGGLYAEIWAEVSEDVAYVILRVSMRRLSGPWIGDAELAILLKGPFGANHAVRPESEWPFQSFEEYFSLPLAAGDA